MEERKLHHAYLGNGITFWEDGDRDYKGHISEDREITIYRNKRPFTDANMKKIEEFARSGNMIYSNGDSKGFLVLSPLSPLTKECINDATYEALQLSVEKVDGKEYVCQGRTIYSYFPENFNDIPKIHNPENKKFCLTEYKREYNGHTLYRIRALKDFGSVKAGKLGGYVEYEHNLSQHGNCWLYGNSGAYQLAKVTDNAIVTNSVLSGCAIAKDNARMVFSSMSGSCTIEDNATAYQADITGDVIISDSCRVSGTLDFSGTVKDNVFMISPAIVVKGEKIELSDNVQIRDRVHIEDNAKISGQVYLSDNAIVCNNAEVHGDMDGDGVIIKDYSFVGGWSRVRDNVVICDSAKVLDMCLVRENAFLGNNAKLLNAAEVSGNAKISQNAVLSGCAKAKDNAVVMGEACIGDFALVEGSSIVKESISDNKENTKTTAKSINTKKSDNELTL